MSRPLEPYASDGDQLRNAASHDPAAEAAADYGEAVSYQLAPTAPPLDPAEIDSSDNAVEVVVMWGELSILHVEHLCPPRPFYVGEAEDEAGLAPDFLIGRESIGIDRLPIAVESNGSTAIVFPPGAGGDVTMDGHVVTLSELAARGQLEPCLELGGGLQCRLPRGATGRVHHGGFTFILKPTTGARRIGIAGASRIDPKQLTWIGASVAFHLALLASFYFLPPRSGGLAFDLLNADSRFTQYVLEARETDDAEVPDWVPEAAKTDDGGGGKRHDGDEGQAGKKDEKKTDNRYAIKGPANNEDPHMSREEAIEVAMAAGIIGTLRANAGTWNTPTSPYGRDTALANDPLSAIGASMGKQFGMSDGFGGLGMTGPGRGAGGRGKGTIGTGPLGTIGHEGCCGSGRGYGTGTDGLRGRHARPAPFIRMGQADVRGSLAREVIARIIHQHVNEVRYCYTQELTGHPDLKGRVAVKFIIAPTGVVQAAALASSTLGDAAVEQCIVDAVGRWLFPAPEGGGIVIVTYPFVLQQTGT